LAGPMKVTVCSLARELRLNPKRIIAEIRGEGIYAARSTDRIPAGIVRRLRAKFRRPRAPGHPRPIGPLPAGHISSGPIPAGPITGPITGPINDAADHTNCVSITGIARVGGFNGPASRNDFNRQDFDPGKNGRSDGLTTDEIDFLLSILSPNKRKPKRRLASKASA
jgi:hypothetical protein